jgi:hypothetical protein
LYPLSQFNQQTLFEEKLFHTPTKNTEEICGVVRNSVEISSAKIAKLIINIKFQPIQNVSESYK